MQRTELHWIKEQMEILRKIKWKQANYIGHILRTNGLIKLLKER